MSDTESKKPDTDAATPAKSRGPETQKERWVKYGANVVLVSVVVVLLGVVAAAIAQDPRAKARIDTTHAGLYSLKPQTRQILKDLKQDVRIVSLYSRTKPPADRERADDYVDLATPVADLLDEYKRFGGGRIEVEAIDPTQNPSKVDDLITQVTERYGGEVKQYRDFIEGFAKTHDEIKQLAGDETAKVDALDPASLKGTELGQTVNLAGRSLEGSLQDMEDSKESRERQLKLKPPNYKGAVDNIRDDLTQLASIGEGVAKAFGDLKDDRAPDAVKQYAAEAAPRYAALGKRASEVLEQIKKLGELKLDDLRQTLRARDGIIVMGPKDMRVIPVEQVWQYDQNLRRALTTGEKKLKPQFHGEQQVTSAILALTQERKPKVAFVRAGGPPLTSAGVPFFSPPGDLSRVANRLKEYNFEVLEKDLTGMWAMQSQMQQRGMPPEPEPDDAQLKDAVWIVIATPPQGGGPMGAAPSISPRVAEHLKAGGSALFLFWPQGADMAGALDEFGVKVRLDAVAAHEAVPASGPQGDFINQAQREPLVFIVNDYGQHMLAEPLRSLDAPMVAPVPVTTEPKAGVKQWNLIPLPAEPPVWGETNIEGLRQGEEPRFDAGSDFKPQGPLFMGAAAQREQGEGRVVVIGNMQFLRNEMLQILDPVLREQGYIANRFPGSVELFTNSVFWLSKMEPMIAISPAAMDVSRIRPMSPGGERFWRNFVLPVGLPLLVIVAGALMYVRRRD